MFFSVINVFTQVRKVIGTTAFTRFDNKNSESMISVVTGGWSQGENLAEGVGLANVGGPPPNTQKR